MYFASYYRWLVLRHWIQVRPSDRVLDVGCDDGEIVARIQAASKTALDLNPRCPDPATRLIRGDARHLPLASAAFDAVFSFDIIEHIDDDVAVLAEMVRVLADDGTLWISTPSAGFFIFPRFLTARANRGWGHVRNGYTLAAIQERLPVGTVVEVMYWNESALRFMHAVLRVLDELSSSLTQALAGLCFEIDRHFPDGSNGHLFIAIRKSLVFDQASR